MINIEFISIGDELLCGKTVNTNAAFLGKKIADAGYAITRQTSLPDSRHLLKEGLQEALHHSEIVITSGGLGSTCDDLTKLIAAELFNSDFYFDEAFANQLKARYGTQLKSITEQATLPTKAEIIPNFLGTAPGLIFNNGHSLLILLPGVPKEFEEMVTMFVMGFLEKQITTPLKRYSESLYFFGVFESDADPYLRQLKEIYPAVQMGIYSSLGFLTIQFSIYESSAASASESLKPCVDLISKTFPKNLFESKTGRIEEAILELFTQKKITLSLAESCTGGCLAARLTKVPGASHYFLGSFVTYSNQLKMSILNISQDLLNTHGAVSSEVVGEMARNCLSLAGSDWSVAISGIAGPDGGTPEKPVGTVWMAIASKGQEPVIWNLKLNGNREMIIEKIVNHVLGKLYSLVKH